jgi:hypothetical protein
MGWVSPRRGRHAGLLIGALVLVAACGGTTSPSAAGSASSPEASTSGEPSSAAPATASPSASVVASPTDSPVAAGKLCAKEFEACPLPAGTYRAAPFEPGFTFTTEGADWVNQRAWPHGGGVNYVDGAFFWMAGSMDGMIDDKHVDIGDSADDFVSFLGRPTDWKVDDPRPITIDGVAGVAVDTVTGPKARPGLLHFPEDAFNTDPKEKIRWIILEKDGTRVIFLLDAFKEANFDAVSARVQPIIDSIAWE